MELAEAMKILNECTRWELRDHAFGDTEMGWIKDGEEIAEGYFGGKSAHISIKELGASWSPTRFDGEEARKLRECGTLGHVERNDETGPDTYSEGEVMPGLSKGDVFHELTGKYLDE